MAAVSQNTKDDILKAFDRYDADRNMTLNKSEFRSILVACGMKQENVNALFNHVDHNHDECISSKEFVNWLFNTTGTEADDGLSSTKMTKVQKHIERLSMTPAEALDDWFEFMNEVKDNARYAVMRDTIVLDPSKLRQKKKGGDEKNTPVTLKTIFETMDTNKNGKVSMSEFVSGCNRLGIDCEDEMLVTLFRMIDQEKKIRKKIVVKGGVVADYAELSAEEAENMMSAAVEDGTASNHLAAAEKRAELARKRVEWLQGQGMDAEYIEEDEVEFKGALSAQTGVDVEFVQKDGVLDLKEFQKAFEELQKAS